jgi:hypothetical protein
MTSHGNENRPGMYRTIETWLRVLVALALFDVVLVLVAYAIHVAGR